eukprot:scaffold28261_cov112-Isochrysis_galbana.AAC.3
MFAGRDEAYWSAHNVVVVAPGTCAEQAWRAVCRREECGPRPLPIGFLPTSCLTHVQCINASKDLSKRLGGAQRDGPTPDLRRHAWFADLH